MSVNYSSSTNDSSSLRPCAGYVTVGYKTFIVTNNILLLPLSLLVLDVGIRRWQRQRSAASPAVTSFSDFFTYNMAVMELIGVVGQAINFCCHYICLPGMRAMGSILVIFPWNGQMGFPILTCVDRYVAVVYPITYRRVKQKWGVCIRNIATGLVWLECAIGVAYWFLFLMESVLATLPSICVLCVFFVVLTFCSFSILSVLIRPRPGEGGRTGIWVDQSKMRAFKTITIIMAVLWLRFGGSLVCAVVIISPAVSLCVASVVGSLQMWLSLPSSLVLPLLFLHRAGKLPGCKHNTDTDPSRRNQ